MKILVTGCAGFIGFHLAKRLLKSGYEVVGLDIVNDYYDPKLKFDRLKEFDVYDSFHFIRLDLQQFDELEELFQREKFDYVCNLAAQAGVRYSIINPFAYVNSNIVGFVNLLECCKRNKIKHLVYASSSSIYGLNETVPFSTKDNADHPVSLYAASKKSNELMAHSYSHLFKLPTTGLRFFTVYGPWGRPDMALFLFTKAMIEGNQIRVFNNGEMHRDFTYIDDIVDGIVKSMENSPYRVFNIGNSKPVKLLDFIEQLENELGIKAIKHFEAMQPGDVKMTWADVSDLQDLLGYKSSTTLEAGIHEFVKWYKEYYKIETHSVI
ncbi:UNVERIFIED_CONTAM: hypothetical protein GTU68_001331 [Idotea baltica]|nr:hypothetical protein [Idotea baltica]